MGEKSWFENTERWFQLKHRGAKQSSKHQEIAEQPPSRPHPTTDEPRNSQKDMAVKQGRRKDLGPMHYSDGGAIGALIYSRVDWSIAELVCVDYIVHGSGIG